MTPQRWQHVKAVLADALNQESTSARNAFLDVACADDVELRREVMALLDEPADDVEACVEYAGSGALLPVPETPQSSWHDRRVGAYALERELGRGGMGAVWLARRADGRFDQQVAIKLLKRGTDTDEVLRRFRAERQILARLEHPNIARLLDGGETDDGLPFFVMEFVEGLPVTQFCQERKFSMAERLALFRKVCAAVQFAHQNLVVHRDLKPANILVTAEGEPKLLDFGIAKLLDDANAANSGLEITALGHQRLTPAYASPEQVRGEAVTTVSDVYALGAILYELLSGASAHAFRTRSAASAEELQRVVVREEPARPSLRAADSETRRWLRGDLDQVILKALHKEPARRYPSVGALSEDLWRYLEGRPVRARPDTWGYRTAKFVRRNKTAVTVGAFVIAALVGSWAETLREAARARRRFNDVRQLAESFLFEFHDAIANVPGTVAARQLVAARGVQYLDNLAREASTDRELQFKLAEAYLKVGDVQGRPYTANVGDTAGAVRSYEKALAVVAPLAAAERGESSTEARRIASDGCERLGIVHSRLNHPAVAAEYHGRALSLRTRLEHDDPRHKDVWQRAIVSSHLGLGDAIMAGNHLEQKLGDYRAALEHYRRALPIVERLHAENPDEAADRRRLAQVCARIAAMLSEIASATDDPAAFREAFGFHERTLALDEASLRADPGNAALQRSLADELVMSAYARTLARENLPVALAECRRALDIERSLAASDATNTEARQDIAHARYVTGRVLQLAGDTTEAAKNYQESCELLETLNALHPENVETTYDLARVRRGLAETATATVPK